MRRGRDRITCCLRALAGSVGGGCLLPCCRLLLRPGTQQTLFERMCPPPLSCPQIVDVLLQRYPTTSEHDVELLIEHQGASAASAEGGSSSSPASAPSSAVRPDRLRLATLVRLGG